MPISLEHFNFGDIANPETGDPMFKYWLKKEFEEWGQYEKFFEVKKGDIVLNIVIKLLAWYQKLLYVHVL